MRKTHEILKPGTYLVIGDVMVDEYNLGTVSRISPEAPIPVLDFACRMRFPGGAANVALNLAKLGNHVELVGLTGDDESGEWLKDCLKGEGVGISGILTDRARSTTNKVRFATNQQSILRVDYEDKRPVEAQVTKEIAVYIEDFLQTHRVEGVLISDYNKGLIAGDTATNPLAILISKISKMPFICGADTKKTGPSLSLFSAFHFIKPNLSELKNTVNMKDRIMGALPDACRRYLELSQVKSVLVTLGAEGMYHYDGERGVHVPAVRAAACDVTGAGDTVFAVIMLALANGLNWIEAMRLANIAASAVIESPGTKTISMSELDRRVEIVRKTQPEYFDSATGSKNHRAAQKARNEDCTY